MNEKNLTWGATQHANYVNSCRNGIRAAPGRGSTPILAGSTNRNHAGWDSWLQSVASSMASDVRISSHIYPGNLGSPLQNTNAVANYITYDCALAPNRTLWVTEMGLRDSQVQCGPAWNDKPAYLVAMHQQVGYSGVPKDFIYRFTRNGGDSFANFGVYATNCGYEALAYVAG